MGREKERGKGFLCGNDVGFLIRKPQKGLQVGDVRDCYSLLSGELSSQDTLF